MAPVPGFAVTSIKVSQEIPMFYGWRSWFVMFWIQNNTSNAIQPLLPQIKFDDYSSVILTAYDGYYSDGIIPKPMDLGATKLAPGEKKYLTYYGDDAGDNSAKKPTTLSFLLLDNGMNLDAPIPVAH